MKKWRNCRDWRSIIVASRVVLDFGVNAESTRHLQTTANELVFYQDFRREDNYSLWSAKNCAFAALFFFFMAHNLLGIGFGVTASRSIRSPTPIAAAITVSTLSTVAFVAIFLVALFLAWKRSEEDLGLLAVGTLLSRSHFLLPFRPCRHRLLRVGAEVDGTLIMCNNGRALLNGRCCICSVS